LNPLGLSWTQLEHHWNIIGTSLEHHWNRLDSDKNQAWGTEDGSPRMEAGRQRPEAGGRGMEVGRGLNIMIFYE
jgi:hypothetical protein